MQAVAALVVQGLGHKAGIQAVAGGNSFDSTFKSCLLYTSAARSVCFLGRDPARPDVCVVAQEKNSLGLPGASLAFTRCV